MTIGSTCSLPNTTGAVSASSPRGSACSPAKPAPGVVELIEHAAGGVERASAGLRQRKPARRSRDQPRVEFVFERRQMAADSGERHVELAPRRRQTPGVGDSNKDAHGGEAVHSIIPKSRNINWNNRQYSPWAEWTI